MTNCEQSSCGVLTIRRRAARIALVLAIMLLAAVAATRSAQAQNFTTLATISGNPGGLVQDAAGNVYGTTCCAGSGFGTVFRVDTAGTTTVLYSFTGGSDGINPSGSLVLDAVGNIYGSTLGGGSSGFGTIFKLDTSGAETLLYSFTGGADGALPGGLVSDALGNLYGAAFSGGIIVTSICGSGCGTVFKVDPSGNETTIHSFTGQAGDGAGPSGHLALDTMANIYGTTVGSGRAGTIFKLDPGGAETVVYTSPSFTGEPTGGLALDAAGSIYFTKTSGSHCTTVCGGGVFKLDSSGAVTGLHGFAGPPDGFTPNDLVVDLAGNLFGTTSAGGTGLCTFGQPPTTVGCGAIFEITAGSETVLYSFTGQADGKSPAAGLILDAAGNLYGTTSSTVFKFTPAVVPPPTPDYSLSATAFAPGSISPGASSTSTVSVTALNAFSGSVFFTCSVTPALALSPTCSIKPGSTNPGTPATLTVSTAAPGSALFSSKASGFFYALWLPLIGLVATGVGVSSDQERRTKILTTVALACVLFTGLASQVACGGGNSGPPPPRVGGTPAGTYSITVNGVDASGALKHSTPTRILMVQ